MSIHYHYSEFAGQEVIVSSGTSLFYPRHMHMRHWTLGLVRRGMAELENPAGTHRMDMGGFFVVPPRMPHSLCIAAHSELLTLCLDEEYTLHHTYRTPPGMRCFLLAQECKVLERMLDQMTRQPRSLEERQAGGKIRRLAQRLVAQPEQALSITEMAKIVCASPWHFLRRFQSEIGMTPHAFLLNCKIRRLRSLLRGKVAADDAAFLMGFTDQSHMHKLFKLHHNLTPRQFVLASGKLDGAAV
ncbi:MAG: AraC family transcriptional regulator [Betaproteobacteria bacterium]|nr:AraC family transcriptional regulator [Betaproteobacteria bacterium]